MPLLSDHQKSRFDRDGFLPFEHLIDAAGIAGLRAALASLQARWAAELGAAVGDYVRVVSQWTNLWESHPAFAAQLRSPIATEIAAELIGCDRIRVFHDHLISKPPEANGAVPWHQDYPYWPVSSPRAVSCWLALDDVTIESGCMHFMPGAQREGEHAAVDFLNDRKEWGPRTQDIVAVPLRAGDCVFHHCLSWHTTPRNSTNLDRRAYITILMDAACRWDPDHSRWHPMNKRVTVVPGDVFNDDAFPVVGGR